MTFELTTIDPNNCTIEELKQEIDRLNDLKDEYYGLEQSIKIFINSVYGALASIYFIGYNVNCAEAITLQGQDIIKFTNKIIQEYFYNEWHLDKELHEKMGLTVVEKINPYNQICVYNDTDSSYVTFDPVMKSCDTKDDGVDFILKLKKYRLNDYLKNKFEQYASDYNTTNLQELELEKIAYSGMMVAKKKYILDLAWKDPGVRYKPQEKIKPVGIEIVQGSTPKFARKVLKEMIALILNKKKSLQYGDIIKKLKDYKQQFCLQETEDIAKTMSIGDYEKYILEDKKQLTIRDKCPINVRAAAVYNHKLLNSKWKTKYNLIKTGDKVKLYYCKGETDIFGFLPNNYPYEFAYPVDFDKQFSTIIVEPLNRFVNVLGMPDIPSNLLYAKSLF